MRERLVLPLGVAASYIYINIYTYSKHSLFLPTRGVLTTVCLTAIINIIVPPLCKTPVCSGFLGGSRGAGLLGSFVVSFTGLKGSSFGRVGSHKSHWSVRASSGVPFGLGFSTTFYRSHQPYIAVFRLCTNCSLLGVCENLFGVAPLSHVFRPFGRRILYI